MGIQFCGVDPDHPLGEGYISEALPSREELGLPDGVELVMRAMGKPALGKIYWMDNGGPGRGCFVTPVMFFDERPSNGCCLVHNGSGEFLRVELYRDGHDLYQVNVPDCFLNPPVRPYDGSRDESAEESVARCGVGHKFRGVAVEPCMDDVVGQYLREMGDVLKGL